MKLTVSCSSKLKESGTSSLRDTVTSWQNETVTQTLKLMLYDNAICSPRKAVCCILREMMACTLEVTSVTFALTVHVICALTETMTGALKVTATLTIYLSET